MSFEVSLLLGGLVIPFACSLLLVAIANSLLPRSTRFLGEATVYLVTPLALTLALLLSSWFRGRDFYALDEPWLVLPIIFAAIVWLETVLRWLSVWAPRSNKQTASVDSLAYCDEEGSEWSLLSTTRLLVFATSAVVLVPKGAGWKDFAETQSYWVLAVLAVASVMFYALQRMSNQGQVRWVAWIAIGALLGNAGLAATSFLSLAELILAFSSSLAAVAVYRGWMPDGKSSQLLNCTLSILVPATSAAAYFHSTAPVPWFCYGTIMICPMVVVLADWMLLRRFGVWGRFLSVAILTAGIVAAAVIWAHQSVPASEW